MRVLVTNDDGIHGEGLQVLAAAAERCGHEVMVAAPSWDSSGASASLTAVEQHGRVPFEETRLRGVAGRCIAVEAAPAFIVRSAMSGAFGPAPEVVLSGVNDGPNTGHAVLHSGTVGAALTAATHSTPAVAFSLEAGDAPRPWDTAAEVVLAVMERAGWEQLRGQVLNVNVPHVDPGRLLGLRRARLAPFGAVTVNVTEVGTGYVSLRYSAPEEDAAHDTDVALLAAGYATLTVLDPIGERLEADLGSLADLSPSPQAP